MQNFTLYLYGTSACHLCEEASALLHAVNLTLESSNRSLIWHEIDIVDDDALLERYSLTIPVLQLIHPQTKSELNWPFSQNDICVFLMPFQY